MTRNGRKVLGTAAAVGTLCLAYLLGDHEGEKRGHQEQQAEEFRQDFPANAYATGHSHGRRRGYQQGFEDAAEITVLEFEADLLYPKSPCLPPNASDRYFFIDDIGKNSLSRAQGHKKHFLQYYMSHTD